MNGYQLPLVVAVIDHKGGHLTTKSLQTEFWMQNSERLMCVQSEGKSIETKVFTSLLGLLEQQFHAFCAFAEVDIAGAVAFEISYLIVFQLFR